MCDLKTYYLNEKPIKKIENEIRDLGVYISNDLKWTTHINKITAKAYARLYCLFKALRLSNYDLLTKMYITYVRPILEFSSSVFNPYTKKDIVKLEKVQMRACNMIYFRCLKTNLPIKPNYKKLLNLLNLKTLQERRFINDLVTIHKIFRKKINLNEKNTPILIPSRTRGNKLKFSYQTSKNNIRHNFFLIKMTKIYENLSKKIDLNVTPDKLRIILNSLNLNSYLKNK